jgi:hypothetical protein
MLDVVDFIDFPFIYENPRHEDNDEWVRSDQFTDEVFDVLQRPIIPIYSDNGWYIGQLEPSGSLLSHLSGEYFASEKEAQKAIKDGFIAKRNQEILCLSFALRGVGILRMGKNYKLYIKR